MRFRFQSSARCFGSGDSNNCRTTFPLLYGRVRLLQYSMRNIHAFDVLVGQRVLRIFLLDSLHIIRTYSCALLIELEDIICRITREVVEPSKQQRQVRHYARQILKWWCQAGLQKRSIGRECRVLRYIRQSLRPTIHLHCPYTKNGHGSPAILYR